MNLKFAILLLATTYSVNASSVHPPGETDDGSGGVTCDKGYENTGNSTHIVCSACPDGTYKDAIGTSACTDVAAGYQGVNATGQYTALGAVGTVICPRDTYNGEPPGGPQDLTGGCKSAQPGYRVAGLTGIYPEYDTSDYATGIQQSPCPNGYFNADGIGDCDDKVQGGHFGADANGVAVTSGATQQAECADGTFNEPNAQQLVLGICESCFPGSFSNGNTRKKNADGSWQEPRETCSDIPDGHQGENMTATGKGSTGFAKCGGGTFSEDGGNSDVWTCQPYQQCVIGAGLVQNSGSNKEDISCAECTGNTYSDAPSSTHGCKNHGACAAGSGVKNPGTNSTNIVCEVCDDAAASTLGKFSKDESLTQVCTAHSKCAQGSGVKTKGNATDDTVCEACNDADAGTVGEFSDLNDDTQVCTAHAKCPVGKGLQTAGTDKANTVCDDCGDNKYSDEDKIAACKDIDKCPKGEGLQTAGNATHNIVCEVCTGTTFSDQNDRIQVCTEHKQCEKGDGKTADGTAEADTQCAECTGNTYSDAKDTNACKPLSAGYEIVTNDQGKQVGQSKCARGSWNNGTFAVCQDIPDGSQGTNVDGIGKGANGFQECVDGKFSEDGGNSEVYQCQAHKDCGQGEGKTAYGTTTADTVCTACDGIDFYMDLATHKKACKSIGKCGFGQGFVEAGTAVKDITCVACTGNTFSDKDDRATACEAQPTCGNQIDGASRLTDATAQQKGYCAACNAGAAAQTGLDTEDCLCAPGKGWNVNQCVACVNPDFNIAWSVKDVPCVEAACPVGQGIKDNFDTTKGNGDNCEVCPAGEYSVSNKTGQCTNVPAGKQGVDANGAYAATGAVNVQDCASGTYATDQMTSCQPHSTCGLGRGKVTNGTKETDTVCNDCTGTTFSDIDDKSACQDLKAGYEIVKDSNNKHVNEVLCPKGSYNKAGDLKVECVDIDAGYQGTGVNAEGKGATDIEKCPDNFFSIDGGSKTVPLCQAIGAGYEAVTGSDANAGAINRAACGANKYATATDDTCLDIGAGFEAVTGADQAAGAVNRTACPNGHYATATMDACVARSKCGKGKGLKTAGDATKNNVCEDCDGVNKYSDIEDESVCKDIDTCPKGQGLQAAGSAQNNIQCVPCTGNTYSDENDRVQTCQAHNDCLAGQGKTADGTNQTDTQCAECGDDGFTAVPGKVACTPHKKCPIGKGKTADGTNTTDTVCATCTGTTYSDKVEKAACKDLDPGNSIVTNGNGENIYQENCDVGSYNTGANVACIDIPAGSQGTSMDAQGNGAQGIQACGDDKFSVDGGNIGAFVCQDHITCQKGRGKKAGTGTKTSQVVCEPCTGTTFSDAVSTAKCQEHSTCPKGKGLKTAGTDETDTVCEDCDGTNTYSDEDAKTACKPQTLQCGLQIDGTPRLVGRNASQTGSCAACNDGAAAQNGLDTESCLCAPGEGWTDKCAACDAGQYKFNDAWSAQGVACATAACPKGQGIKANFDTTKNSTANCEVCQAGEYSDSTTTGQCDNVLIGKQGVDVNGDYAATGAVAAQDCAAGTFRDASRTKCTDFTDCVPGERVKLAGTASADRECEACGAGKFTNANNQATCTDHKVCVAGEKVKSQPSASTDRGCEACVSGTSFSTANNAAACTLFATCPAGEFIDFAGNTTADRTCEACVGKFTDAKNQAACKDYTDCAAGDFIKTVGTATTDRVCDKCAAGSFTNAQNQVTCTACDASANFAANVSSTQCDPFKDCPAGEFIKTAGTATTDRVCVACAAGSFTNALNQATCTACDASANFAANVGSTQCDPFKDCPAGEFIDFAGNTTADRECEACVGKFTNALNQAACKDYKDCAAGAFIKTAGTATADRVCQACDGTKEFTNANNQATCTPHKVCVAGERVKSQPSASADRKCEACDGTKEFTGTPNQPTCTLHSDCEAGKGVKAGDEGTASKDTKCTACDAGQFTSAPGKLACANHTTCVKGKGVKVGGAGTASADTVCEDCGPNTYSDVNDYSACKAQTTCGKKLDGSSRLIGSVDVQNKLSCAGCTGRAVAATDNDDCKCPAATVLDARDNTCKDVAVATPEGEQQLVGVTAVIKGEAKIQSPINLCIESNLLKLRKELAKDLAVAESAVELTCKNSARRRLDVAAKLLRRNLAASYDISFTITAPNTVSATITATVSQSQTFVQAVATATGQSAAAITIVSVVAHEVNDPLVRADIFHDKYRTASRVYRHLTFPIPSGLGMAGIGTDAGSLTFNLDAPLLVSVANRPTAGVEGCTPLTSFYNSIRDKLVSELPYAISKFSINTGAQIQLESLRKDIENAQKDAHSVKMFCGDLARILKIRRNTFHAYTSAWADLKFGKGKLSKFKGQEPISSWKKSKDAGPRFRSHHGARDGHITTAPVHGHHGSQFRSHHAAGSQFRHHHGSNARRMLAAGINPTHEDVVRFALRLAEHEPNVVLELMH